MDVLPSKRSPPDGLLRRPVRRHRAACRQLQRETADVFFRSPNPRRLAGRSPPPESRITSRRPRPSRPRRSSARKAAASEVKLQYKRYRTQARTGIRRRTAAASPKRTAPPSEAVSAAGTASARKQDLFSFYFFLPWLKMVKRRTPLPENGRSCAFLTYKLRLTKMRKGGAIPCSLKNRSAVVPAVPFCRCFTMFPVRCRIAGVA